jgi:threonine dehydrogenase-like Zn-dependent dehydrogenase
MDDLQRALWALDNGTFDIAPLITHAFTLEDTKAAMEASMSRADGYIKGIVVPDFSKLESRDGYKGIGGD